MDHSGSYVFATLPELALPSFAKHESYWAAGSGYDTMVTLWNTGHQPEDLLLRFYYADGSGKYTMAVHLDPLGSQVVDINQLIASGVNDWKNRPFSMRQQTGSLSFENLDGHTKSMTVNIGVAVYNPFTATCGCYCTPCCNYNNFGISPAIIQLQVDGNFNIYGTACYCNGTMYYNMSGYITNVSANVFDANGNQITGTGPGNTTVYYQFNAIIVGGANCYGAYQGGCSYAAPEAEAPAQVDPPPCGDVRDSIISEYENTTLNQTGYIPYCGDFTDSASTPHFTFAELNTGDYSWAILEPQLLTGIENIRSNAGNNPLTVSSCYRNPAHNARVGGKPDSQHMLGLAVDFATYDEETIWNQLDAAAKAASACVEPSNLILNYNHLHADWRAGGCPQGW